MIWDFLVFLIKAVALIPLGIICGKYVNSVIINGKEEQYDTFYTVIFFVLSIFLVFVCSI